MLDVKIANVHAAIIFLRGSIPLFRFPPWRKIMAQKLPICSAYALMLGFVVYLLG